ncbi:hypothetical protein FR932_01385 [Moritella marina ATCC 15381]|uniref:Flagellar protein FliT n=1 Tax=Moritella marina ATCC 15381 TaxID=1202962 RepID=A0A5J6WFE5_MORMI|nr:hypothetical protein [Moritella marina]QFI36576.1 hypothetical protein FR932_01385 [Moritella marina ATCC 15381]
MACTDVELMANIKALSADANAAISAEELTLCDELLLQRQYLIEQLVALANPAQCPRSHAFLLHIMAEDQTQITRLNTLKSGIESQQVTTKRRSKSINRYLAIKQF